MKIFLSGSKTLGALPQAVIERLNGYIGEGCMFLVGDCHGADLAFQKFLHGRRVKNVAIYCGGGVARFSVGGWRAVAIRGTVHMGYEVYALKDKKMAEDADRALMLWDGKSRGTRNNIARMQNMGKPAEVFLVKNGRTIQKFVI